MTGRGVLALLAGVTACSGDAWVFRPHDAGTPAPDQSGPRDDGGTSPPDVGITDVSADSAPPPGDVAIGARCRFEEAACDPVRNVGCPAGQVCYPYAARPICDTPATAPGWDQPCASSGQRCAPGFRCCTNCPPLQNVCKRVCCPGEDAHCADTATGGRSGARCTGTAFEDVGNCE